MHSLPWQHKGSAILSHAVLTGAPSSLTWCWRRSVCHLHWSNNNNNSGLQLSVGLITVIMLYSPEPSKTMCGMQNTGLSAWGHMYMSVFILHACPFLEESLLKQLCYPDLSVSNAGRTAFRIHLCCHKFFSPWQKTILLMGPPFPAPLLSYFRVSEPRTTYLLKSFPCPTFTFIFLCEQTRDHAPTLF